MDAETTVAARREVFVRTLVDEGLVDLARLVDMAGTPRTVAVAAARPEDARRPVGVGPAEAVSTRASSARAARS